MGTGEINVVGVIKNNRIYSMTFYNCILLIMPYEPSVKRKRDTHAVYRSHFIYILRFNYYGTTVIR